MPIEEWLIVLLTYNLKDFQLKNQHFKESLTMMRIVLVLIFSSYDHTCFDYGSSLFMIGFVPPQRMSIPCKIFFTSFYNCEQI